MQIVFTDKRARARMHLGSVPGVRACLRVQITAIRIRSGILRAIWSRRGQSPPGTLGRVHIRMESAWRARQVRALILNFSILRNYGSDRFRERHNFRDN